MKKEQTEKLGFKKIRSIEVKHRTNIQERVSGDT